MTTYDGSSDGQSDSGDTSAQDKIPARLNRDPAPPAQERIDSVQGRLLDPATALVVRGVVPRPTVYVGPRLVVAARRDADDLLPQLQEVAADLDWEVELDRTFARTRVTDREDTLLGTTRYTLSVKSGTAATAPDGWVLLQQARARYGIEALEGVGLDHVLFVTDAKKRRRPHWDSNVPHWDSNPRPHWDSNPTEALASYGRPGSGGRQPIAFTGPPPYRRPDAEITGRRPVVAILDTGCGAHPWFEGGIVRTDVKIDGDQIGYFDPETDPEAAGDYVGPLDGSIDDLAGHGTFIAGLVRQACPDANLIAWRVVNSAGPIIESDLIDALTRIAELIRREADGESGGERIDVLNLSMGYYHETPEDALFDPTVYDILRLIGECGTVVVCSAGNDATARPMFPAAFGPWIGGGGVPADDDCAPVVSVGALNPDRTVALFSNTGPWVRAYEPGAAVVSTMPKFQGGLEPIARTWAYGLQRESIDPDDFSGGFALWSGTSFAAPRMAGKIVAAMVDDLAALDEEESRDAALARAWSAVAEATTIAPE